MADFCKDCSIDIFGSDYGDLEGLSRWWDTYIFRRYPLVICESCGPIQVDHKGRCISPDCPICNARRNGALRHASLV